MNKVLERQLKKIFGSLETVPKGIELFLGLVSATYDHAEEDRVMIERSMEISSRELGELNTRLQSDSETLKRQLEELARAKKDERSYQDILDNLSEGCQIISTDWKYIYVNDALVKQGKQAREDLLGRTMMERYPGIEKTDVFAKIKHCMEEREAQEIETEFTFPDGSKGWFEIKIEPVPRGVFIISEDITARKQQLNESNKRTNELERLNKLMIDRELKMIELKKEVDSLKAQS